MSFLHRGDWRLRVADFGTGSRAIVLIHGWKQSHRLWDPVTARLAQRYRVVAYDMRGMGESDKINARYDFDEHADDLGFVLDRLELRDVTLVGWSMGCTVALRALQRGEPRIAALALVSGPMRLTRTPDYPFGMTDERLDQLLEELVRTWPAGERGLNADYLLQPSDEVLDWLTDIALQTPLPVAIAAVRAQRALDMTTVLSELQIPVAAIYGRHDRHWPPELASYVAERTGGEAHVFEHSAHCAPLEESDRFAAVIAALAKRVEGESTRKEPIERSP